MANEAAFLIDIKYSDYADVQDAMRRLRRVFGRSGKDVEIPFTYDGTAFRLCYVHNNGESQFTVYNAPTGHRDYERMDRETDDITHRMRMHILKMPEVQALIVG